MSLVFLDTNLSQKFQEALPLSVAKEYTKLGGDYQNRLSDWFVKGDGVTKVSNKNRRLYIPIIKLDQEEIPSSEIETEVRAFIDEKSKGEFDEIDYAQGLIFPKGKKVPVKIGKTLNKLKAPNHLINDFANDPFRSGGKGKKNDTDLYAVITRHPIDVAGMSSDRKWDSCKDLGSKRIVYDDPENIAKKGEFAHMIKTEIDKLLVAYLIRDDDFNIRTPVARVNIIPYTNTKGDTIYSTTIKNVYKDGSLNYELNKSFIKTIQQWLNKKHKKIPLGTYTADDDSIYLDRAPEYLTAKEISKDTDIFQNAMEDFDYDQQEILEDGIEQGLDVSWYADTDFDVNQMYAIQAGLKNDLDVSIYADRKYNYQQMEQIKDGLLINLPVQSLYADPDFLAYQMEIIKDGAEEGIDAKRYADPLFSLEQMEQIKKGFEHGLDVSWYADLKYDDEQMNVIRAGLEHGLDISRYTNPKYDYQQMDIIASGLNQGIDVSSYANPNFSIDKMEKILLKLLDDKNK